MKITKSLKSLIFEILVFDFKLVDELFSSDMIMDFLNDVWDLKSMPSTDKRFDNAYRDVYHHIINNDDWNYSELFEHRLKLLDNDREYKKFIEAIINPKYRKIEDDIIVVILELNRTLGKEGYKLAISDYSENGLPIYRVYEKNDIDNLPIDTKLNSIPFFVEKNPRGMSKSKSSHNTPEIFPSFVVVHNVKWNDYGTESAFSLFYYDNNCVCNYIGELKIICGEELYPKKHLPDNFINLTSLFCSLGQSRSYYDRIKYYFKHDYDSILFSLKDAAFFPHIQESFENRIVFRQSLIREDKAERLLREVRNILNETEQSNYYSFTFVFKPLFSDIPIDVDFDFNTDDDIPNRIIGLIGKNGTGKTQLVTSLPNRISRKEKDFFKPSIPLFSKVIGVSYSLFDKFDIPINTASFNYVYCGLRSVDGNFLQEQDLVVRFHHSWKKIEEQERINKWRKILLNFLDVDILNQFLVPREEVKVYKNKYEVDVKEFKRINKELSSGQSIMLYIITEIVANIRLDSLLIYDEPETHLHPNAITMLMSTIYELVDEFESFCIIATHSPLVIRELFSRNVYVVERHGNIPSVRRIGLESFGENLSVLTDEVFGNKDVPKHYKKIIDYFAASGEAFEDIVSKLEYDNIPLSLNARLYILSKLS
ncbi:AAA family ATPase [Rufibacter quisquiliarum]|uniref:ABC-type nitrate/sulfonate/bicarbonate transport system ATPase subunit n=1 Tax=Rufibacter quisquiliarum TaxID=1549639 RepID=A0A839GRY7_9BACT|nr:AAA family ATPase [Rufibacter quisquiliarum]MBA9077188.1 ABC-type nitrate/sulfonate/bicarbonate transport system ATPase subunit [Rufibacter quisquiliarum]